MQRIVSAEIDLEVAAPADLIFSITAAQPVPVALETLSFTQGDRVYAPVEIAAETGTRLHRFTAEAGPLAVRYDAIVDGPAPSLATSELETITYLRPSRYCQSDEVFAQARRQFRGLSGHELVAAVTDFTSTSISYSPGMSLGTDSAVTTLLTGQGVCRDYAHVVISFLRAMEVPARYVACYAPGLQPMDFHAVAEAYIDGAWYVIDATRLAFRPTLVRIATGRDAADCAFLTFHGAHVGLNRLHVDARVAGATASTGIATDDPSVLVQLA